MYFSILLGGGQGKVWKIPYFFFSTLKASLRTHPFYNWADVTVQTDYRLWASVTFLGLRLYHPPPPTHINFACALPRMSSLLLLAPIKLCLVLTDFLLLCQKLVNCLIAWILLAAVSASINRDFRNTFLYFNAFLDSTLTW